MRLNFFHNRPKAAAINIKAYLDRIGETKDPPSESYLRRLHLAHLRRIPFENLDIHYQKKIILDYQKIFNKVITNNRGGFCYELNGLFYHLLYHLGFDCHLISAKVRNDAGEYGPDFDHMAIIVNIDNRQWFVDVGFGRGVTYPKKIEKNVVQMDYSDYWRFIIDPDDNFIMQNSADASTFHSKLLFNTDEKQIIQFMEMCDHHQNSPLSPFTQKKIISQLTPNGRITLTDKSLRILELGQTQEIELMNEDEFLSKLEHHFGISLKQLTMG